ncbi:hypothetical protein [Vibrio agarivorans]|uniref:hypothetical protein n=1 Tax=Vibrio agarivorans TaxID=153622 RepID=UPI0025B547A3|nr:hypothetical protein [Vibrio agarivorans]MDN3661105.1 hypothetical protein [Vibrio agarivorans]
MVRRRFFSKTEITAVRDADTLSLIADPLFLINGIFVDVRTSHKDDLDKAINALLADDPITLVGHIEDAHIEVTGAPDAFVIDPYAVTVTDHSKHLINALVMLVNDRLPAECDDEDKLGELSELAQNLRNRSFNVRLLIQG